MPTVMKSGSLNFLEPSGPLQACNGIAFYRRNVPSPNYSNTQRMKKKPVNANSIRIKYSGFFFFFFFFSSTILYEFWLAQLFLSIVSSPAPSVSNFSLPYFPDRSSHHPPNLILASLSVLLRTVSYSLQPTQPPVQWVPGLSRG